MSTAAPRIRPRNAEELTAMLRAAVGAEMQRLCVVGGASKRALYAPSQAVTVLDVSGLNGVVAYEPEEMVLSLRAGTPLDYVESLLAEQRQMLAFEPPDYTKLLDAQPARSTIGGVLGCGFGGPRRLSAGNVRDHLLGFEAVSARGERFRAGGRVIKNVTGYDLSKLMVGSWGTLAVLTEISLRVVPRPEYEATLLVQRDDDLAQALAGLRAALATPLEVSAAAHLPDARSAFRLEGFRGPVEERMRALRARLASAGSQSVLEQAESAAFWHAVRDVSMFAGEDLLWRISLPASAAFSTVTAIAERAVCTALFDWGGALIWLALDPTSDAATVRKIVETAGGQAWLLRAPQDLRAVLGAAPDVADGVAALSRRIKRSYDPLNVLGRGPYAYLGD